MLCSTMCGVPVAIGHFVWYGTGYSQVQMRVPHVTAVAPRKAAFSYWCATQQMMAAAG
jgi:hypothetical protein